MSAGIKANSDGSAAIQVGGSDAITITSGLAVSINGGVNYPLVSGTAVASTSGTSIDFTGIPSTVKRITVMFKGVSTNGASLVQIQLGDSGGIETSGYISNAVLIGPSTTYSSSTTGLTMSASGGASVITSGAVFICLISGNIWVETGSFARDDAVGYVTATSGSKTLSDVLTQVRITTVNGTDTFDAGSINIMWE